MKPPEFDGSDYVPSLDRERLAGDLERIQVLMLDGQWRTLREISQATGAPEGSVGAQLRHLRKRRFGSWQVPKKNLGNGLWAYRVLRPLPSQQLELASIARPTYGRVG